LSKISSQPAGTIGIAANETGRYVVFAMCLAAIQSPPYSQIAWAIGSDVVNSRNNLVEDRMVGDWMWFMDDDHAFAPDMLTRLLDWNVEVVAPLCLMRQKPFSPVAQFDGSSINMQEIPSEGLIEVDKTGTAGMLVRKSVFDKIRAAYGGKIFQKNEDISEDYLFCNKLNELNIPIHIDCGQILGHCTSTVIWPNELEDGQRVVTFQIADSYNVSVGYE